jgi:hypothetical protein
MSTTSAIALSGMDVATLRLQVSARNVANSLSDASVPQQVVQLDTSPGTAAIVQPALPTPVSPDEITGAFRTNPYSVLSNDMVQQLIARFDLVADAHVIRADATMQATLLYHLA